jgi:hypothetical protein
VTFSKEQQEALDAIVKERVQREKAAHADELKAWQTKIAGTEEERKAYQQRVAELEQQSLTADQIAQRKIAAEKEAADNALKNATTERDTWKKKLLDTTKKASLTNAANTSGAVNADHIMAILERDTVVQEVGDKLETVVKLTVTKDGKTEEQVFTPEQAVAHLKSQPVHKNLFRPEGTGGTGGSNVEKGKINPNDMSYEDYKKARKSGAV